MERLSPRSVVASALSPLLESIGRELEERGQRVRQLEALRATPGRARSEVRALLAELAAQRRELLHCKKELERLGCSVLGTRPLTIRIHPRQGNTRRSVVWQPRSFPND